MENKTIQTQKTKRIDCPCCLGRGTVLIGGNFTKDYDEYVDEDGLVTCDRCYGEGEVESK